MRLEIELSNMIQEIYLPKSNNLFDTEDTVLSLASSNTTNAIFFCCILSIGKTNPVHVARYFEDGAFVGFYSSVVHSQLKQYLNLDQLLPYKVYTADDIKSNIERNESLNANRKKGG